MEILPLNPQNVGGGIPQSTGGQGGAPPATKPKSVDGKGSQTPAPNFNGDSVLKYTSTTNGDLVFNCKLFGENYIFTKSLAVNMVLTDTSGIVGAKVQGKMVNWYSNNSNYDGAQFIFTSQQLESLKADIQYKATIEFTLSGKSYTQVINANNVTLATNEWNIVQVTNSDLILEFKSVAPKHKASVPTSVTSPPSNYNANDATSMQSYNGSIDFSYQGTTSTKSVILCGGNLSEKYTCTEYGTNQFYCYVSVPNSTQSFGLYYLVSINGESPKLDTTNSNVGTYKGVQCSYYIYEPSKSN